MEGATGRRRAAATEDLLSRVYRLSTTMNPAERQIAKVIISDPEFAVHSHTVDIANRAGVSAATVTRFCRTVGCEGLRELKLDLAKVLAVGSRYLRPLKASIPPSKVVAETVSQIHKALDSLVEQIDADTVSRVATAIVEADKVAVFGGGGGSSMASMEAENRLFRLGLHVSHCNDSQLQHMIASTLKGGDVLVVLSITGRYNPIIRATDVARMYGAHTIAITAPNSPLAEVASEVVPFAIDEPASIMCPTPARFALLALIDIIAYEVAELLGDKAVEPMRRIKFQLVHTRDGDDSGPLGD